ncbi:MAG: DUF6492 family protein, partial [Actinomycetota bacterium]|nr:DUF6492 family protein [Actinomycetota bacterium]
DAQSPSEPMIDVVIPAHEKDLAVLNRSVRGVLRHVGPVRRVVVVSAAPFAMPDARVSWAPEPSPPALPGLAEVRAACMARGPGLAARASWIYQQLLKLGAGAYVPDLSPSYLVIDSDVIFLRPVSFDPGDVRRFPYSLAYEYHRPYHDAFERLVGEAPPIGHSLTAHHMLYDRALLDELFTELEDRHGKAWHAAYLDAGDPNEASSISEMDIYGLWVIARHPELSQRRQLAWRDVHTVPTAFGRAQYGIDYDFVAAHAWARQRRSERALDVGARLARELQARLRG